jgi:hypothetical protein
MKKIIRAIFILALLIGIAYLLYMISMFSLFEVVRNKIVQIEIANKPYYIEIFYIPSNATSLDYIQVVKTMNKQENILVSYENYNSVVNHVISNDTLQLILNNTNLLKSKNDTLSLKLP